MSTGLLSAKGQATLDRPALPSSGQRLLHATESWPAHAIYVLGLATLIVLFPAGSLEGLWHPDTLFFVSLGGLAAWRYSWGLLHYVRSIIYRRYVFVRMRRAADAQVALVAGGHDAPHSYLLVTSFRQSGDTSATVYRAAFKAALAAPGHATVIASLVEVGDQRLVTSMYRLLCQETSRVRLVIVRIDGTGKRDALAYGFRAIAKMDPNPDDVVAVIDGDSIVPANLFERCTGFFREDPTVGALTTDEVSEVRGRAIFHIWYSLRFAQRHMLMSSNGLSRRVLTLTGRMSMFRADVVCNPDFIRQVEADYLEHWRLGRIRFLTGDDKSSWFWLLKNRYRMLYVPDVLVSTIEEPPTNAFLPAAAQLMTRWFGNMLRTNGRALKLGPARTGLFTWWVILDQRVSMWTSLAGPVMVLLAGLFVSPFAFLAYALWTLATRYLLTLMLLSSRPRVSALYPFFIYFNQVFGSVIKTYIFFRPDRQRWTRQKTTLAGASRGAISSPFMHALAASVFVAALACLTGQLPLPDLAVLRHVVGWV